MNREQILGQIGLDARLQLVSRDQLQFLHKLRSISLLSPLKCSSLNHVFIAETIKKRYTHAVCLQVHDLPAYSIVNSVAQIRPLCGKEQEGGCICAVMSLETFF